MNRPKSRSRRHRNGVRKDPAVHASLSSKPDCQRTGQTVARQESRPADRFHSLGRNRRTGQAGRPHCLSGTTKPQRRDKLDAPRPVEGLIYSPSSPLSTPLDRRFRFFSPARRLLQKGDLNLRSASADSTPLKGFTRRPDIRRSPRWCKRR